MPAIARNDVRMKLRNQDSGRFRITRAVKNLELCLLHVGDLPRQSLQLAENLGGVALAQLPKGGDGRQVA
jgi:hypothetical protein